MNYFSPAQQARLSQLEQQQGMFLNPTQPQNPNVIYSVVQGFEGAKNYFINPGKTGLLFDMMENEFYLKEVDSMGMSKLRKFVFKETQLPTSTTSTISNDSQLTKRIENIENALQILLNQKVEKSEKKEETKK